MGDHHPAGPGSPGGGGGGGTSWQVERRRYRRHQPDGSVVETLAYGCPLCEEEFGDVPALISHAWQAHGTPLGSDAAARSEPPPLEGGGTGRPAKQRVTRLILEDGSAVIVCPVCQRRLADEAAFLEHAAAEHGRAWASPGGGAGGESHQLDLLHSACRRSWHARRGEAVRRLCLVSLGSFCGVKCAIQQLGLGEAHLPFDWIRSTLQGVRSLVDGNFEGFFSVASCCRVEGTGLRVHRAARHSFWHDDVSEAQTREKLRRRLDRFRALCEEKRDLLLIRICATTDEAEELAALYETLSGRLGAPGTARRRVLLAAVVDGQPGFEGPLRVPGWPAVSAFLQPRADEAVALEGLAYRRAIAAAVDVALDAPEGCDAATGFGLGENVAALEPTRLQPCDAGLRSGYEGLACFEEDPEAVHVDLGAFDAGAPASNG